jgi:hypothetical protein
MGMLARGADLSQWSQYPHEQEICFPLLTGLEVKTTRVEGTVLIVQVELNMNLNAQLIEQIHTKRHNLVKSLSDNSMLEVDFAWKNWRHELEENGRWENKWRKLVQARFDQIHNVSPQTFDKDLTFKGAVAKACEVTKWSLEAQMVDLEVIVDLLKAELISLPIVRLTPLVTKGVDDVLTVVRSFFKDGPTTKGKGTKLLREILFTMAQAKEHETRRKICEILPTVCKQGDRPILDLLSSICKDEHIFVRTAAADSLGQASEYGDPDVVAVLFESSQNPEGGNIFRAKASEALSKVAKQGDTAIVKMWSLMAKEKGTHASHEIRAAAIKGMGEVADRGDKLALMDCMAASRDREALVRRAAATALGQVAPEGDKAVTKLLASLKNDCDIDVSNNATRAIIEVQVSNMAMWKSMSRTTTDQGPGNIVTGAMSKVASKKTK